MLKHSVSGFVLGALVMGAASIYAQNAAPAAPAAPTAKKEAYTDLESVMVQYVQATDQLAACKQQLGQKGVLDLGNDVRNRVEAAHPGYTIDWKTGALVPKTPSK